ncbi:general stress protein [Saccharothrix deserti]|uniref:general stress protein n=1 Tax=Saccharothrix deserti TaxID=2593674 RepID=UPI00131C1348|nr:general stress protein [Saccharothrix deserti]
MNTNPLLPGGPTNVPTPPTGWPIGSYATYTEAQRAVDYLADKDFPVHDVTIVGVGPMVVERVTARLTWGRVLAGGAASGIWFGLFVGLLLGLLGTAPLPLAILTGLVTGVSFGTAFAAASYASVRGRRGFASTTQLVAGRYDVLCEPRNAEKGRDFLAELALKAPSSP